jgi:hypothetical protein
VRALLEEEDPMRHGHMTERWNQAQIGRHLLVTIAIALVWMIAVAATY